MKSDIVAVILAGGFGSRLRPVLKDVPKPMALVAGRPFIEWVIRYFRCQGIRRFVISTGYRAEIIEEYIKSNEIPGTKIVCVPENTPLGTAGGFVNAVQKSGLTSSKWLVANGDSLVLASLSEFLESLEKEPIVSGILALSVEDASRYGTLEVGRNNRLVSFTEKQRGTGLINAGIYLFKNETLELFGSMVPLSFETDVFPRLISRSTPIGVTAVKAPFLDIGTPKSLTEATGFVDLNISFFENKEGEI